MASVPQTRNNISPSFMPGGRASKLTTEYITPTKNPEGMVLTIEHEYTPEYGAIAKDTAAYRDVKVTKQIKTKQSLLFEERKETLQPSGGVLSHTRHTNLMFYDTARYLEAEKAYKEYMKSRSCYNTNLTSSAPGVELDAATMALMRWTDFAYLIFDENIQYNLSVPELVSVQMKHVIYDIEYGSLLRESTYVWEGECAEERSGLPDWAVFIWDRWVSCFPIFGKVYNVPGPDGYPLFATLKSVEHVHYVPITERTTLRRVIKQECSNYSVFILHKTQAVPIENDTTEPEITASTNSTVLLDSIPRLSRRDLTDSQARYGSYVGGDLAAQLTARRRGDPTTAIAVSSIVSSIDEYMATVAANQLCTKTEDYKQYGRSDLVGLIKEVVQDIKSGNQTLIERVQYAFPALTATKIGMVLELYQIDYEISDVDRLADYIPNYQDVITKYDQEVSNWLNLLACQKNIPRAVVTSIWSVYKAVTPAQAITSWHEALSEAKVPIVYSHGDALAVYAMWKSYREKITWWQARVSEWKLRLAQAENSNVAFEFFNLTMPPCVGDLVSVNTARDTSLTSLVATNVSISISNDSVPTTSVTTIQVPNVTR